MSYPGDHQWDLRTMARFSTFREEIPLSFPRGIGSRTGVLGPLAVEPEAAVAQDTA